MASKELLEAIEEAGEEQDILLMEPRAEYDAFILGLCVRGPESFVVYDYNALIEHLAKDADPESEDPHTSAVEHFDFNINQGGPGMPGFVTLD